MCVHLCIYTTSVPVDERTLTHVQYEFPLSEEAEWLRQPHRVLVEYDEGQKEQPPLEGG